MLGADVDVDVDVVEEVDVTEVERDHLVLADDPPPGVALTDVAPWALSRAVSIEVMLSDVAPSEVKLRVDEPSEIAFTVVRLVEDAPIEVVL